MGDGLRKVLSVVLAAFAVVLLGWGAGDLLSGAPSTMLQLDTAVIDFGVMGPFDKRSLEVCVTNTSDEQSEIENINVTCGCTTATISSHIIEPGEDATLTITADASEVRGSGFERAVWFDAVAGRRYERHHLDAFGQVDRSSELRPIPGRLRIVVPHGSEVRRTFTMLGSETGLAALPAEIEYEGGIVEVSAVDSASSIGMGTRDLTLRCRASEELTIGSHEGQIRIVLNGKREVSATIPVLLEVVDPIMPFPRRLFVAFALSDGTVEVPFRLVRYDDAIVPIESIASSRDIEWQTSAEGSTILTFDAENWQPGIIQDLMRVTTSDGTILEVPLVVVAGDSDQGN